MDRLFYGFNDQTYRKTVPCFQTVLFIGKKRSVPR